MTAAPTHRIAWPQVGTVMAAFALLSLQAIFAILPNNGPDEPSHLEYIHILAWQRRLPTVAETHVIQHPPSYYLAMAVIWRAMGVRQRPESLPRDPRSIALLTPAAARGRVVLRLCSLVTGCATLYVLALLLAELGVPVRHQGWLLAVIAMNPMLQYISAVVGNEALSVCYSSVICLALIRAHRRGGLTVAGAAKLGVLVGAGTWVKQTTLFAAPVLLLVVWAAGPRTTRRRRLGACCGAMLVAGCGWPLYSHHISGQFFPNYVAPWEQDYLGDKILHSPVRLLSAYLIVLCTSLLPDWSNRFVNHYLPGVVTLLFWLLLPALTVVCRRRPGARVRWLSALALASLTVGIMVQVVFTDWRIMVGGRYLLNGSAWALALLASAVHRRRLRSKPWRPATWVWASVAGLGLADACWWYLVLLHYQSLMPQ